MALELPPAAMAEYRVGGMANRRDRSIQHLNAMDFRTRPVFLFCPGSAWCSRLRPVIVLVLALFAAGPAAAQSLRGSRASLDQQNRQAERHDFTYLRGRQDLRRMVGAGLLVPIDGGSHYRLNDVSFDVARPEVRLFVERLSAQYHRACGEPLIVTSLTRPRSYQPSNASARSVHPTGMALDLRVPQQASCRKWLESTLLHLEGQRVLDATKERSPAHYHVALFPDAYVAYVASAGRRSTPAATSRAVAKPAHTVRPGETLWRIAQQYDTTPAAIKRANDLPTAAIRAGQSLVIPGSGD